MCSIVVVCRVDANLAQGATTMAEIKQKSRRIMLIKLCKTFPVLALLSLAIPAFAQSPFPSTLDERATRGLLLIMTRTNVQEGVQLLDEAARGGAMRPNTAWVGFTLQDVISTPDNDKAFEYLNDVKETTKLQLPF